MKRIISLCIVCLLTMGLFATLPVSAAAGLSVTASSADVTVGQNVTVTLKYDGGGQPIGGVDGSLTYDTNVFSYVSFSGNDVQVNGGAGKMRFIYTPSTAQAPTALTITFTFKSDAPGACNFVAATTEFFNDNDYSSLGSPGGNVTVTASNPTLSGNADLKSLVPSKGTLSPKFSPDVTEYKISVNNSVTSLTLSAIPDHSGAKTSISGKNALEVGKNTRVITVTAPNGTTKKYTVVITRAAAPSTTSGTASTQPTGTKPTIPTPPEDALEVEVNGKLLTILDTQASADLPVGFTWSNVTVNLVEVPAAINRETGMTLLYLVGEDKADNDFYIYSAQTNTLTRYRRMNVENNAYLLYDLPADQPAPAGATKGKLAYGNHYVTAYVYEDAALNDFYVVWAAPVGGEAGWYTYDKKEETLQRYHATPGGVNVTAPTSTNPTKTTRPSKATTAHVAAGKNGGFSLSNLLKEPRNLIMFGGVTLVGLVVLIVIILLIVSIGRNKKGKHRKGKH